MFFFEVGTAQNPKYIKLIDSNWSFLFDLLDIPDTTKWEGVLVDLQPTVIIDLLYRFSSFPNITILNAAIGGSLYFSEIQTCKTYDEIDWEMRLKSAESYNDKIIDQFSESFSVYTIDLATLLSLAGTTPIGLLSLDVQGSEVEILQSYDWRVRPIYLEVEPHSKHATELISDILHENGYELVRGIPESEDDDIDWIQRVNYLWRDIIGGKA